jgi:hypothetical protein
MLPELSVVRAFEPEQEVKVEIASPPPVISKPPAIVEVAVVPVAVKKEVSRPFVKEPKRV